MNKKTNHFAMIAAMTEEQRFEYFYKECLVDGSLMFAGGLLKYAAQRYENNVALLCDDTTISFKELYWRALGVTNALRERGVTVGDRVLILFENSIEFYIAYWGAWQLGAVVAPLNTFLHEKEVIHIIEDAKPKAAIVAKKSSGPFKALVSIILTEDDMVQHPMPDSMPVYDIPKVPADDLAALLYTSGTTGFPKGVMLSSSNIINASIQACTRLNVADDVRTFGVLPLFHSFAQNTCVWAPCVAGATTILVPKIDRKHILNALRFKPTIFLGVPALYAVLCLLREAHLDDVVYFICGGDALPDKIRALFELVYRRKICNGYGLTEAAPVISEEMEDLLLPTNCVGRPVLRVEIAIRDLQGNDLPQGSIGILWVKGPNIMLGYYNAPEQTQSVLQNGWLNTGDFARVDESGRLYICGRYKDLIIHKGINIYPAEIENIILSYPAVIAVGVIGKPDDEGEIPVAFVALRYPVPNIETELRNFCMQHLGTYKIPRSFIVVETMPMTALGKVDKKALKAQLLKKNE